MGLWVRDYGSWYYPKYSKYMHTRNLSYIKNPYCPYMFFLHTQVYHSVRKVYHGIRKAYHGVRKVYHDVKKVYHGVRKVYHGVRKV